MTWTLPNGRSFGCARSPFVRDRRSGISPSDRSGSTSRPARSCAPRIGSPFRSTFGRRSRRTRARRRNEDESDRPDYRQSARLADSCRDLGGRDRIRSVRRQVLAAASRSLEGVEQVSFAPVRRDRASVLVREDQRARDDSGDRAQPARARSTARAGHVVRQGSARWRDSAIAARRKTRREFADSIKKAPCDSTGLACSRACASTFPSPSRIRATSTSSSRPPTSTSRSTMRTTRCSARKSAMRCSRTRCRSERRR